MEGWKLCVLMELNGFATSEENFGKKLVGWLEFVLVKSPVCVVNDANLGSSSLAQCNR